MTEPLIRTQVMPISSWNNILTMPFTYVLHVSCDGKITPILCGVVGGHTALQLHCSLANVTVLDKYWQTHERKES